MSKRILSVATTIAFGLLLLLADHVGLLSFISSHVNLQLKVQLIIYIITPIFSIVFIILGVFRLIKGIEILKKPNKGYLSEDDIPGEKPKILTKWYDVMADKIEYAGPKLFLGVAAIIVGLGFLKVSFDYFFR